jgi:hypothetical protein
VNRLQDQLAGPMMEIARATYGQNARFPSFSRVGTPYVHEKFLFVGGLSVQLQSRGSLERLRLRLQPIF